MSMRNKGHSQRPPAFHKKKSIPLHYQEHFNLVLHSHVPLSLGSNKRMTISEKRKETILYVLEQLTPTRLQYKFCW